MSDRNASGSILPASIRLGRIAGIPIGLHFSWFIIAAFITVSLAAQFRATQLDWSPLLVWIIDLLRTGRRCVIVQSGGRILGLVTPNEVRHVDRESWPETTVGDIMRPLDSLKTVTPDTPATEAFTTMAREDVNQLPVVNRGRLEGVVSRGQILRLLQARSELSA